MRATPDGTEGFERCRPKNPAPDETANISGCKPGNPTEEENSLPAPLDTLRRIEENRQQVIRTGPRIFNYVP